MCQNYPKVVCRNDGRYEVTFNIDGRRFRLQNGLRFGIPLKPNNFPLAERHLQANVLASQIHQKLLQGEKPRCSPTIITKKQPDLFFIHKALDLKLNQNFSDHYKNALILAYKKIKEAAHNDFINTESIELVLNQYHNNTSFNTLRRNMNILCNCAMTLGLESNPIKQIKAKRAIAKLHKPIHNIPELLDEIKRFNQNLYLCCLLTYGCLLRPHREIRQLTWGNFSTNLDKVILSGNQNKSGRNRIVPVPFFVRKELISKSSKLNIFTSIEKPPNKDYFKTLWKRFKDRSKLLETNQTLYSFRHSGAIEVYNRTKSIEKLKLVMGHSSILVSLTYLRGLEISELEENDMPML